MPIKARRQTKMTVDHKVPMKPDPTFATTPNIVNASKSPKDAAKGVARLSKVRSKGVKSAYKNRKRRNCLKYIPGFIRRKRLTTTKEHMKAPTTAEEAEAAIILAHRTIRHSK